MLQAMHIKTHLDFAKNHINKDSSFGHQLFGQMKQKFSFLDTEMLLCLTVKLSNQGTWSLKHGDQSSIRLWGCFSANGIGSFVKVDRMIKKEQYIHILDQNINQSAEKHGLENQWTVQQDNESKHMSQLGK